MLGQELFDRETVVLFIDQLRSILSAGQFIETEQQDDSFRASEAVPGYTSSPQHNNTCRSIAIAVADSNVQNPD